jgi:autoinducer 2-degrading protein
MPSPRGVIDSSYGGETPFMLLARCHVKPECLDEYLEAARVADAGVKASEPGMLHHTFDVDPEDPLQYVWSEVYANDKALLAHLNNPPLQKFVSQHMEMGDNFSIEVYGTLDDETKKAFSASGFDIKYFDTQLGYSRLAMPAEPPSVEAFLKAWLEALTLAATTKDGAAFDAMWERFWAPDAVVIRPSGNPMDKAIWRGMVTSQDITFESSECISVDSTTIFAGGKAAAVTFTLHDKFTYKGTPNDDIAKYSAMLELTDAGSWRMMHAHRATGQKPA